jgi:adenylate cyclase
VPTDPGFVLHELPLLRSRALLALARGDEDGHRNFSEQHRAKAAAAGFDALIAAADSAITVAQHDSAAQ